MKKIVPISLLAALMTAGCGSRHDFTVEGHLGDMATDTLLVEYLLPSPRLDTVVAEKGEFTYRLTPDTTTMFTFVVDRHQRIPVIAEGGGKLTITRKDGEWTTQGEGANAYLGEVRAQLEGLEDKALKDSVEALMRRVPDSYVNLWLMDTYLARDTMPDVARMKRAIEGMSGVLKDTPYLSALSSKLDALEKVQQQRYLNLPTYTDNKGHRFTASDLRDQYVCVHFWASWGDDNRSAQDSLRTMLTKMKNEKFKVVSVSLDMDKKEWLRACPKDSTRWIQVCSFKGWNDEAVKSTGIQRLPTTVLLNPDKRIVGQDLSPDETVKKVKELIEEKKKTEAEKKKREAELKAKKK